MSSTTIQIPSGTQFLSSVLPHLPANCLFDKGRVGGGGTTIALTDSRPTVIAVPFVPLIENKVAQHPNAFGVMQGVSVKQIKQYAAKTRCPKIMVTYDSLPKVMEAFGSDVADYNLLVDEYHLLFTQYNFREAAVQRVLQNYQAFKEHCFMTATVLEDEFILDELKHLPLVKAEWADVREVKVNSMYERGSVNRAVANLINNFLSGKQEGNAYIFVNSVEFIKEMRQTCGLTDVNTRAIWGKSNKKETGIIRGSSLDAPKKINFITSTNFEGADFYDTEGRTFIVSDGSKTHTLVDISTSFQQIAGRIRRTPDSKYSDEITHIFNKTRYSGNLSYEEFRESTQQQEIKSKRLVSDYQNLGEEAREGIEKVANPLYITKEGNNFVYDANKLKIDLYNFKITNHLYALRGNVTQELDSRGFAVNEGTLNTRKELGLDSPAASSFQQVVEELEALSQEDGMNSFVNTCLGLTPESEAAFAKYPFLQDALSLLKFAGIKAVNYNQTNIKRKLIKSLDKGPEQKISKMLSPHIPSAGKFLSAKRSKKLFQAIYQELGIAKTAFGHHITDYYEVTPASSRESGKLEVGYIIKHSSPFFKKVAA